ncbi:MAG: roadblock/LC7 domain-containing protein [Cyanobacteriota bacterium]
MFCLEIIKIDVVGFLVFTYLKIWRIGVVLKNKNEFEKTLRALFSLSSVFWIFSNLNNIAMAAPAEAQKAAAGGGGSSMMIVAVVIAVAGAGGGAAFVAMQKKSSGGTKKGGNIAPPKASTNLTPNVKTPVNAPTIKSPVNTPAPKSPTSTTSATGPLHPMEITSSLPPQHMPAPKTETIPKVAPSIPTPVFPSNSNSGLFDSNQLSSDLDTIFKDEGKKEDKKPEKAPLFDSNLLDDDLDSLFIEVNKKPEPKKVVEEKRGLFDSSQLDNDLDSLFSTPTETKKAPEPVAQAPAFSLDSLDFMSSPTPEPKKEAPSSSPSLDFSGLSSFDSTPAPKQDSNQAFSLDSLDFLSSPPKEEPKPSSNEAFSLPSFDLSSITSAATPTPTPSATPNLANLGSPADRIDLSTTTMGINISEYLTSINAETTRKEEAKSDSGAISIGKMTVDQSALEEIIKKAEKGGKAGLTTTQVITAVKGKTLDTLLVDINNVQGIKGSMIVGKDGLVIANTMGPDVDKDLVGALTSSLFTNIENQVKKIKKGALKKLTVETEIGTYILTEIDMGTLVVFSQDRQKINFTNIFRAISGITGKK